MLQEKQNNNQEWISRLEALDALPGEPSPDTNPTWEKLHTRLGNKKRNKATVWHWAAAAIVIASLGIIFTPKNKKEATVAVKEIQKKQMPVIENIIERSPVVANKLTITDQKHKKQKTSNKKVSRAEISPVQLNGYPDAVQSPSMVITPILDAQDTNIATGIPEPSKKKIRVVHINQLDNYIEQKATRDYFTTNTRDGLIKIKLSPSK